MGRKRVYNADELLRRSNSQSIAITDRVIGGSYLSKSAQDGTTFDIGIGTTTPVAEAKLHVKKGSAGSSPTFDDNDVVVIENSSLYNTLINILAANSKVSGVAMSDNDSRLQGVLAYDHATNNMDTYTEGTKRSTLNSTGLGVDQATPRTKLDVVKGDAGLDPLFDSNDVAIFENSSSYNSVVQVFAANTKKSAVAFSDNDSRTAGAVSYDHATDTFQIYQNGTLRFIINSTGITSYNGPLTLPEQSAPSTPASGYSTLYPDSTGLWSFKNDAGTSYNLVKDILDSSGNKRTWGTPTTGQLIKLSGSDLVGQNASSTATASYVPIADGSAHLDTWISNATPTARGLDYQPIKQVGVCMEYVSTGSIKLKIQGSDGKAQLQFTDGTNWITKQISSDITLDITTTGANGRDTGSRTANTIWYVWQILKSSDGTVAGLFSLSNSSPTMPSGYDYKMLVGAILDGNGVSTTNIVDFIHDSLTNTLEFKWAGTSSFPATGPIVAGNATTATAANLTGFVPSSVKFVDVQVYFTATAAVKCYILQGTTYGTWSAYLGGSGDFTAKYRLPLVGLTTSLYYFFGSAAAGRSCYISVIGWTF